MSHYDYFEKQLPVPVKAHLPFPTGPGFNIELDSAKIESQRCSIA
jgi:hypothetical protein